MKSSIFVDFFALSLINISCAASVPNTLAMKAILIYKDSKSYGGVLDTNKSTRGTLECEVRYDKEKDRYSGTLINNNYLEDKWGPQILSQEEAKQHYLDLREQDPELKK
jgi:hypothetical protein